MQQNQIVPPPPPMPNELNGVHGLVGVEENSIVLDVRKDSLNVPAKKKSGLARLFGRKDKKTSNAVKIIRKTNSTAVSVENEVFIIGRRLENSLVISDNPNISIIHSVITKLNDKYFLEDAGSTNGTALNSIDLKPFEKIQLKNGDKFRLANEDFEFKVK